MTCDSVAKLIPLYFYGELSPEDEDRFEQHLDSCALCTREIDHHRALAAALDSRQAAVPPQLLDGCRADLMAAIQGGAPRALTTPAQPTQKGPWTLFLEAMGSTFTGLGRLRQPVGAMALITLGFFASRWTTSTSPTAAVAGVAPSDDVFATVRSVRSDPAGRVQIAFDETRRRTLSGSPDDQNIQKLLLAAAHEENAAVRVESMDLLKERTGSTEVRDALLNALAHDPNDGVRLKALEGLKPLASDAQVRKALSQVLLADANPAVRMQVVDLLVAHRDDSIVGVLQGVVKREDNSNVRQKLEKALKDMNASVGTF
jgi:hypothetical protein